MKSKAKVNRLRSSIWHIVAQLFLVLILVGFAFLRHSNAQEGEGESFLLTQTPTMTPTASMTPTSTSILEMTSTITPTMTLTATPPVSTNQALYFPILLSTQKDIFPPRRVTENPPIDFAAAKTSAEERGLAFSFNKIGFHVGVGGNREGLDTWLADLDAAGVPVFLKSSNDAEPLYIAQELSKKSGVPHILVYRDAGRELDNPNYDLPPKDAANISWQLNRNAFPPELDPAYVWIETVNEPGRIRSEWLAEFSLETAKMAVAEGYKYAAFSWSSGVPEPENWEGPKMLEFLQYAGEHPDQVAVALHEYSFQTSAISDGYPYLVGRFQKLFSICDEHDIPRPTVLITEWGWAERDVPDVDAAIEDIKWASWLYSAYPEVKGAAIWYLGPGFSDIDDQAQKLIAPVKDFSLSNYYLYSGDPRPIDESIFIQNPPTRFTKSFQR